ncbi:GNAT family N-acetyltransferase [Rathayibacter toxicus]|uniref:N-acetyltransferase n=1 Tax=Rathayibacter toxicus TaxID=145458 RepID=A0A0C5BUW8_9MICO|nr:GNAT family N-acetyltransferase [Rathayibacter toxicus]AJM78467.1 phosphinothricin acetyltransferase [Rathayibacter toxicus]ALS58346.1 phosphinothricin acetyltransferase [Rathayibacter toxicus]KKM47026.1 phosphinothricin acetyltransferase [Rathayibacter toxicus]PPG20940.1 N-acetyltransferase [Rathayibacter toxicus]PPG46043.1 N-acetyltransferase [Rathayibacter toxicus]
MLEEEYEQRRVLPQHLRKTPEPEPGFSFAIRKAREADLPDIREIYNHYVRNTVVTFDEDDSTLKEWQSKFSRSNALGLPFIVAVSPSGQILGYAMVSPWSSKRAYRFTVESSIYLRAASTGKGLGRVLLTELLERAKAVGIRQVMAVVADKGAEASLALHAQFGFVEVGRMGRVGIKFERWLSTVLLQKTLK